VVSSRHEAGVEAVATWWSSPHQLPLAGLFFVCQKHAARSAWLVGPSGSTGQRYVEKRKLAEE
jgi:hypothetical protein